MTTPSDRLVLTKEDFDHLPRLFRAIALVDAEDGGTVIQEEDAHVQ
jgi:hypothetical protein